METYELNLLGLKRHLPKINIGDITIASFVILGDTELVEKSAQIIARSMPHDIEYLVSPEAKAIPLVHSIAVKTGLDYVVLRKSIKSYMKDYITQPVQSITTKESQILVINGADIEKIRNKKVAIIDDVVSTGGSLSAARRLINKAGAQLGWQASILLEVPAEELDVIEYPELFYIEKLPFWGK